MSSVNERSVNGPIGLVHEVLGEADFELLGAHEPIGGIGALPGRSVFQRHQPGYRPAELGNYDLLARGSAFEQIREVSLGFVQIDLDQVGASDRGYS